MIASLITILYLLNAITPDAAFTFLYVSAFLLIAGEIAFGGHGLLVFNAILAFLVGYAIQLGNNTVFGFALDWQVLFGMAFVETLLLVIFIVVTLKYRKMKASTGKEIMVGSKAAVINWDGTSGRVLIEGEIWKAKSDTALQLQKDEPVTVAAVEGLTITIKI